MHRATLHSVLGIVVLWFVYSTNAASAVLGIDLGTEYIKTTLVKPGIPLEIVLTKDSKRKETSAIAFKPSSVQQNSTSSDTYPERFYGSDALALAPRFPSDVYPNLKLLLGSSPTDDATATQMYTERYPALSLSRADETQKLQFRTNSIGDEGAALLPEELLSMVLKQIRSNAEHMAGAGQTIRDAVITVPCFYTVDERRAVETAAELAGLSVLALMSDGLAVGLDYAKTRTFASITDGAAPEYHLIYDMGAGSTTATILKFQGRTVKDFGKSNKTIQEIAVVGTGWNRLLGGEALNDLVVADMIKKFVGSSGAKKVELEEKLVRSNGRTMAKLRREAERLRQMLSANSATSSSFEALQEDIDFKYKLSRSEFEAMATMQSDQVKQPIEDALAQAQMKFEDLNSVILHGGAVRTPFVQNSLEKLVGDPDKMKSNVNADESACFGAAFRAAGLSPSFKVKEIRTYDIAGYPITMDWTKDGKQRHQKIFISTSQTGTTKKIPFDLLDDFSFQLSQEVPAKSHELASKPIFDIQLSNLTASVVELTRIAGCARENVSMTVSLTLDPEDTLPMMEGGLVECEADTSAKKGLMDGVKGLFGFGSDKEQKPLADLNSNDTAAEPPVASKDTSSAIESSESGQTADSLKKDGAQNNTSPKRKIHSVPLDFKVKALGLPQPSATSLTSIQERLKAFERADTGRRLREELFNGLEAFSYKARDMLENSAFMAVSTTDQRTAIKELLQQTSEWLYGEGSTAGTEAVRERMQALKTLVDPITKREKEQTKRPAAIKALRENLNKADILITSVQEAVDKVAVASSSWAAAASSTASEAAASVSSATDKGNATNEESDSLADLEDEKEATPTPSAPAKRFDPNMIAAYNDFDLFRISSLYNNTKEWFDEKFTAQQELSETEDPVLLSVDMETKAKQLGDLTRELTRKGARWSPSSSAKEKKKTTKKSKTKSKKSNSTTSTTESPTETVQNSSSPTSITESEDLRTEHREL